MSIDNILESGHTFDNSEVSLKFRFRLLNTVMIVIVLTSTLFAILHYTAISPINDFHANANIMFALSNTSFILLLRYKKSWYKYMLILMLASALLTFTSALITLVNDEFRIMWFYITVCLAFFAGGVRYGYTTTFLSIGIILTCNTFFDLELTKLSIVTAITGLLLLSYAIKVYTQKMIDLEENLLYLNTSLQQQVEETVKELRNKEALMIQQARLAQMGELIAMIAHQWRQPLASIAAISANLKISLSLGDEIKPSELEYDLSAIENRTELLSQTIEDFRNFYKTTTTKNVFRIKDALEHSLDVLAPVIEKANIEIDFKNEIVHDIRNFESEITQVFMNIIKNAVDILKEKNMARRISIYTYEENSNAIVLIEDNAGGIPEEILPNIFDPYFSTKQDKNGMGIGLYMSNLIIHKHCSGTLHAKNAENGALFTIKIPL